jgi:hypothetical protein
MIPEFRELIEVAQKYLNDEVHFSYVCAKTEEFLFYSKQLSDVRIREIAEEWHQKSLQVWDEWGRLKEKERITENEYREWVKSQLSVLNNQFGKPNE